MVGLVRPSSVILIIYLLVTIEKFPAYKSSPVESMKNKEFELKEEKATSDIDRENSII